MSQSVPPHPYREFEFAGWQHAAGSYAETFELATQLYGDVLLDAVNLRNGEILLDNACGTGFVAARAAARGAAVVGADFSSAMLAEARRLHPAISFECADAEALPYGDERFDVVVVNFGLHHFPFPERALSEVCRVLRPGGRAACTVWATPDRHALYAIVLDAVRNAGDLGASLPAPPHGGLNTIEGCLTLMRNVGLTPDEARSLLVERRLNLPSIAALTHLIESGTVRLASLLRSQPADRKSAMLHSLEAAASRYATPAGLSVPVAAVLAVATKTVATHDA